METKTRRQVSCFAEVSTFLLLKKCFFIGEKMSKIFQFITNVDGWI